MLDPEGRVISWNIGAQLNKGYAASEIIGKHFSIFYPPGRGDVGAVRRRARDRHPRRSLRGGGLAPPQERRCLLGQRHDHRASERRRRARRLRQGDARSLRPTRRRGGTARGRRPARRAVVEKERIQEFQERFLAILGHDLRNPLAAIDMGAGLLRQRTSDPASIRILDRMSSSSRRMTRMIEQILDLTRSRLAGRPRGRPRADGPPRRSDGDRGRASGRAPDAHAGAPRAFAARRLGPRSTRAGLLELGWKRPCLRRFARRRRSPSRRR